MLMMIHPPEGVEEVQIRKVSILLFAIKQRKKLLNIHDNEKLLSQ